MKEKRKFPKGFKSLDEFRERWSKAMKTYENRCAYCSEKLRKGEKANFHGIALGSDIKIFSQSMGFKGLMIPLYVASENKAIWVRCFGEDPFGDEKGITFGAIVHKECSTEFFLLTEGTQISVPHIETFDLKFVEEIEDDMEEKRLSQGVKERIFLVTVTR